MRRLLDSVALPVPHRSTEPARPRHRREKIDFHTGAEYLGFRRLEGPHTFRERTAHPRGGEFVQATSDHLRVGRAHVQSVPSRRIYRRKLHAASPCSYICINISIGEVDV